MVPENACLGICQIDWGVVPESVSLGHSLIDCGAMPGFERLGCSRVDCGVEPFCGRLRSSRVDCLDSQGNILYSGQLDRDPNSPLSSMCIIDHGFNLNGSAVSMDQLYQARRYIGEILQYGVKLYPINQSINLFLLIRFF